MLRALKAGLAAAGAGGLGWMLHEPKTELVDRPASVREGLPDFALPPEPPYLSVAHGTDRTVMFAAAIDALGGIQRFVRSGETVLLKANAAFATAPLLGATTHPDLIAAVARHCFQAGASKVLVTDNPINDPASTFRLTGIAAAAKAAGADLILPAAHQFEAVTLPGARLIRNWPVLTGPLAGVDRLIGLAPLKDHHRSGASMSIKNWYGLLGGRRNIFHQEIHTIIAELARLVRPTLVVLDATWAMVRNGPTGGSLSDLKPKNTLIAGIDPVAVDVMGAALLDRSPDQLPHLPLAAAAGAGQLDPESLGPIVVSTGS